MRVGHISILVFLVRVIGRDSSFRCETELGNDICDQVNLVLSLDSLHPLRLLMSCWLNFIRR